PIVAGRGFYPARQRRAGRWKSNGGDRTGDALRRRPRLVDRIPAALRELSTHPQRGRVPLRSAQGRVVVRTVHLAGDVDSGDSAAGAPSADVQLSVGGPA